MSGTSVLSPEMGKTLRSEDRRALADIPAAEQMLSARRTPAVG